MNQLEKRRLEGIINSRLATGRRRYEERRDRDFKRKFETLEAKPPKSLLKLADKLNRLHRQLEQEEAQAKAIAERLGFEVDYNHSKERYVLSVLCNREWKGDTYCNDYKEPSLVAHREETEKGTRQFDDLSDRFAIEIWAESSDMGDLMERLSKELEAIA